ncbi:MAG: hypothetical protein IMY80_06170, partial [Chloroflexi bacterium]|nr:hypothetical protein [Chloroflexota bacterium]
LYPLPDLCLPKGLEGKERRTIYLKAWSLFGEYGFLQIVLPAGSSERKAIPCRLHENLKQVHAYVRFKARHLAGIDSLRVDINHREVPPESLSLIPHAGAGFLYALFRLEHGMLCDGANEIGFALRDGCAAVNGDVIIQETEIRVL